MVKNGVAKFLEYKFNEMVHMLPFQFRDEFKEKAYVAGGCIYSLVNDLPVHDYDFFVTDKEFADRLLRYFEEITNKEGFKKSKIGTYRNKRLTITKYAISIGDEFQIVVKYLGSPEEVCEEFDFLHNKFAYKHGEILEFAEWKYIQTNKLYFNEGRVRDVSGTIQRIPKMIDKGFEVSKTEISKMLKRLSEIGFDEREMEIIEDKLTY